jgi:predicted metal-binding protein
MRTIWDFLPHFSTPADVQSTTSGAGQTGTRRQFLFLRIVRVWICGECSGRNFELRIALTALVFFSQQSIDWKFYGDLPDK